MAIKDVRHYFYTMLSQYLEEKQNLADFETALKDGLITEDQMREAVETVTDLENNYHRLAYIMYLLDMPNNKSKKNIYVKQYKNITDELARLGADLNSVKAENSDALVHFKAALKKLSSKDEY
jgi:pyruvate carboxylase